MSDSRSASRTILRFHHFVLWDTQDNRGWLVNGQTVALHLLRGHLKYRAETKDYSFSKLERIGDETPAAAERLLLELEKEKLPAPEGPKNNEEKSKDTASSKDQDDAKKFSIGEVLDGIYAVLLKMRDATESMYEHPGVTGSLRTWIETRWSLAVRGWDFEELSRGTGAHVRVQKFHRDPGWLAFTRELRVSFLFGGDFGEIMHPRTGHCCPHFQTLPKHQDYLAVGMHTIQPLVDKHGAARKPLETVAKLTQHDAWEHDVDPFNHLHGQGDHLDKVDSSCFPVQRLVRIRHNVNDKQKDEKLVKKSKGQLYSWIEVDRMNTSPKDLEKELEQRPPNEGVVVFGNKPDAKKLKQLAQPIRQRNGSSGKPQTASATPTATSKHHPQTEAAQRQSSSNSLRSNASTSIARTPTKAPGQPSVASAQRTPGMSSTDSRTRPNATIAGSVQPQASPAQATTPTAMRKPSNSSVRTTGSVASKATGGSKPQREPSAASLKKTNTNSSDKTASSRSSGNTHSSASGTSAASSRQRQQRLEQQQLGGTTAAAGNSAP